MKYNEEKVDRAALAILLLNYDEQTGRSWKSLPWEITDRLFEAELISDPKSKNQSVILTELGLQKAKEIMAKDFEVKS